MAPPIFSNAWDYAAIGSITNIDVCIIMKKPLFPALTSINEKIMHVSPCTELERNLNGT